MAKINRDDIHLINRYSNWSSGSLSKVLQRHVYSDRTSWKQFLQLFLISLGVGFSTAGILFFFAYNWSGLDKFLKLGIVEGLIVLSLLLSLLPGLNDTVRKIIGSAASVLVGVLFMVFGQVYQTGALEFDFFLQWVLFISIWVLLSDFAPLWLLYLILMHLTIIEYLIQIERNKSTVLPFALLFGLDCLALFTCIVLKNWRNVHVPTWFMQCIALGAAAFATVGIAIGIHGNPDSAFVLLCIATVLIYSWGIRYGWQRKSSFYLSLIPLSVIVMIASLMLKISNAEFMMLLTGIFIVLSVTAVIRMLLTFQKQDDHE